MNPVDAVVICEVGERDADACIECFYVVPPTGWYEEGFPGTQVELDVLCACEERVPLQIWVEGIDLAVDADVVVQPMDRERWDQDEVLASQDLIEQDIEGVMVERRDGAGRAEP